MQQSDMRLPAYILASITFLGLVMLLIFGRDLHKQPAAKAGDAPVPGMKASTRMPASSRGVGKFVSKPVQEEDVAESEEPDEGDEPGLLEPDDAFAEQQGEEDPVLEGGTDGESEGAGLEEDAPQEEAAPAEGSEDMNNEAENGNHQEAGPPPPSADELPS